ncbi:MAG: hypothetical protein ACOCQ4_01675, partial [bacterium]
MNSSPSGGGGNSVGGIGSVSGRATKNVSGDEKMDIKQFDLDNLNLLNLSQELEETINSKRWVIFKGWNINRIRLDVERQKWIRNHIEELGKTAESLAQTKANLFVHEQMVQNLIDGYYKEAEIEAKKAEAQIQELDAQIEESKFKQDRIQAERQMLSLEYAEREAALETKRLENDLLRAKRQDKDAYRRLVDKATQFYDDLPDHLKAFVTVSIQNPNQEVTDEMMMLDQLKDFIADQRKAELDEKKANVSMLQHKADQEKALANIKSTSAEQQRRDFEEEYEDRKPSK